MLHPIVPGRPDVGDHVYLPPFVAPLLAAATHDEDLRPALAAVAGHFGFDSFSYATSAMPEIDRDDVVYVYTTLPRTWVERYDRQAYVAIDPRLRANWASTLPLVWDQTTLRGPGVGANAFLDDALAHGIGSGVSYMFRAAPDCHVFIAFSARTARNDALRLHAIRRNLADLVLFGHYFHAFFMRDSLDRGTRALPRRTPLSRRETECVRLAARGMTTDDIAVKLDIRARTVQFHFDRVRSKLGAANRQEAIAIAVQRNLL